MRVEIATAPFEPHAAMQAMERGAETGALASFIGYCRGAGADGPIAWLELEHYPGFTEQEIARIGAEVSQRYKLQDLLVIHRVGRVMPGEPIVLAAALSAHRAEALAAVDMIMDYLKTDAPFWKKEGTASGPHWVEPTAKDRERRGKW